MADILRNSCTFRLLQGFFRWLSGQFSGSLILGTLRGAWSESLFGGTLLRFANKEDRYPECSAVGQFAARLNHRLAGMHRFGNTLRESACAGLCGRIGALVRGSRILHFLADGGFTGFLLILLGLYAGVDWLLRDVLPIPLLSSSWDELLLILSVLWILWQRIDRDRPASIRANVMDLPVVLFLAVGLMLLNLVSPFLSIAVSGYRATCQYILWFFVVTRLLRDDGDFNRVYGALLVLATAIALHGIYQYVIAVPIPEHWTDQAEQNVRTRVFSIFGSPNIMADFMMICAPMAAGLAYTTKNKTLKLAAWAAALCMCVSCLFTMSRAGWVAMAAAILLFAILVDRRLLLVMLAAAAASLLLPFVASRLGYLFTDDFAASTSNGGRASRWAIGLSYLYSSDPLLGFGLGMFGGAVAMQNKIYAHVSYFYMDNYYLKILVEMGYVGLIFFLLMMAALLVTGGRCLYRCKKRRDPGYPMVAGIFAGLTGVLIHCYFENIFEEPYMMAIFWILAALLVWRGLIRNKELH